MTVAHVSFWRCKKNARSVIKIHIQQANPQGFEPWSTESRLPNVPTRPLCLSEMKTCDYTKYIYTKTWNCTLQAWKSLWWHNCVHSTHEHLIKYLDVVWGNGIASISAQISEAAAICDSKIGRGSWTACLFGSAASNWMQFRLCNFVPSHWIHLIINTDPQNRARRCQ